MIQLFQYRNLCLFFISMALGAFIVSCAPKPRVAVGEMDTPAHHTNVGMKFLDEGKYDDAAREFDLALQMERTFSQAHAGMGLVKACQKEMDAAFDSLKTAKKYAKTWEEKEFVKVGYIRLHTLNRKNDKKWLERAKDEFDEIIEENPKSDVAHFFMGEAYKEVLDFNNAAAMFAKVIQFDKGYVAKADEQWNLVQKIQRALPGTLAGKKIALLPEVTRADVAALFMEELKIDIIYKKRTLKTFDTGFKDPDRAKGSNIDMPLSATDIGTHPLRADIEGVLRVQVRGLENYSDGSFHPNDVINRAAYAMMIEDILIKITGDNALATKFIGNTSPFPDLRADLPYFNAVMVVTSRGIMETTNMATGEFSPLKPISGVDALLVIKKMKEELKIF